MNVSLEPIWSLKDAIDTSLCIRFPFPVPEQMTEQSQRAWKAQITWQAVHILIEIQLDATVCSLFYFTAKSLYMFRVSSHPSSGELKIVTAASGTGHNIGYSYFPPTWSGRDLIKILWPVPEAAVTIFSTPDDGCGRHPKHVEWFRSKIKQTACFCI